MKFKPYRSEFLLFCLLIVAACAITVSAQSGRRQPKPPAAAPVPTPTPEPTPPPKPQKEPELGFLVAVDRSGTFETFPFAYYDAVLRGCVEQLRSGSSAKVDVAQSSINRGEAIKKAKGETTTYVVLLNLKVDRMAGSSEELEVDFVVFTPQTAKVVTSGTSYLNTVRKGPVSVGRGSANAMYRELMLRRAGEDAAERILKAMNLNVPVMR